MFGRKAREARAAIERLHPMHQMLVFHRVLYTTQDREGWWRLVHSLHQHHTAVTGAKWALPPRSLDVVVPLAQVLCEDLGRGDVLALTADLRGPGAPEKIGPSRQLPVRPPLRSATEWFVVDAWLRLRASLGDGSVLEVAVTDRIRHRKVGKRSRSGKHKTKRKTKEVQFIRVTRTLGKGVGASPPGQPPPRWIRVRVKAGRRQAVTAVGRLDRLPPGPEQLHRILSVIAEPFRWAASGPAAGSGRAASGRGAA